MRRPLRSRLLTQLAVALLTCAGAAAVTLYFVGRWAAQPSTLRSVTSAPSAAPAIGPPTLGGSCARGDPAPQSGSTLRPSVVFLSSSEGVASGPWGISVTSNGGWSWSRVYHGPAGSLSFSDPLHGWAVTPRGLLRSVDGGACWTSGAEPPLRLRKVDFVDPEDGYGITVSPSLPSWPKGQGTLVVSHDGGLNWQSISAPPVSHVCFSGVRHGFVGGVEGLFSTSDGGRTWERVRLPAKATTGVAGLACDGNSVWVVLSGKPGAGGAQSYSVYFSANRSTWAPVVADNAQASGSVPEAPGAAPGTLTMFSSDGAVVIGDNPGSASGKVVPLVVTNGGASLSQGNPVPGLSSVSSTSFVSDSTGWVLGPKQSGAGWALYVTTDGGSTWSSEPGATAAS